MRTLIAIAALVAYSGAWGEIQEGNYLLGPSKAEVAPQGNSQDIGEPHIGKFLGLVPGMKLEEVAEVTLIEDPECEVEQDLKWCYHNNVRLLRAEDGLFHLAIASKNEVVTAIRIQPHTAAGFQRLAVEVSRLAERIPPTEKKFRNQFFWASGSLALLYNGSGAPVPRKERGVLSYLDLEMMRE